MVERFRIPFDRVLGRGIERPVRHRQETQHGTDVDDATTPVASHVGHDGARHPDDPEEVRIEDRPGLVDRTLFRSGGGDTEAGVVHEQIDVAFHPHHFRDGGFHRGIAGHVEGQHLERSLARLRSTSAGAVNLVTSHGQPLRRGLTDA
jgi:hypothetical protein